MDDFSVVITTMNRVAFLKRCVDSISNSEVMPKEIIIINDAGEYIVDSLFNFTKEIKLIVINNPESKGANFCRNLGVRNVTSKFVFFIDDDDSFLPSSFSSRLNVFEKDPSLDLVFTGFHLVKSSNLSKIIRTVYPVSNINKNKYYHALIRKGNIIGSTSRVAMKVTSFHSLSGFDESLKSLQDFDLWLRVAKSGNIACDNEIGINYTLHNTENTGGQVSSNYEKHILSSSVIIEKNKDIFIFNQCFLKSNLYLRIAISSIDNFTICKKFAFLSFLCKPNVKSLILFLLPRFVIKKFYSFV